VAKVSQSQNIQGGTAHIHSHTICDKSVACPLPE